MSASGLRPGDRAPDFSLPGTDSQTHELAPAGAPASSQIHELAPAGAAATVVYWTCNHCPYALAWEERMHQASRDYAERGVRFLAVNSNDAERYPADSLDAMRERVGAEGGWPHPYLHDADQSVARSFGAQKTPDVFVLDAEGVVRYRGAPDSDYDDPSQNASWLRGALDAVLAGREPDPSRTEPVGCSVKWK
ncbi:MAG: thioredoxin family protein [Solirubrobacterales bacterium]